MKSRRKLVIDRSPGASDSTTKEDENKSIESFVKRMAEGKTLLLCLN